ncbi:MAG: M15 family metallopeptidase [Ectothiorhodospiraceae bacterium]|jgi:D-alanyl-D-alanine dipeptidase
MHEDTPIPQLSHPDWNHVAEIPIVDDGEPLVPLSLVPERILVQPVYYIDRIPGAVPECYAREGVLERLLEASDRLPPGVRLVVLDAWRPYEVQQFLYEHLEEVIRETEPGIDAGELSRRTREFVAPPSRDPRCPSPHLTGGAVDVTLCDRSGRLLPMGSEFDEVTARSHTGHYEDGAEEAEEVEEAVKNRRVLYHAMVNAGFTNLPSEWWHFDCGNQQWAWYSGEETASYGVIDLEPMAQRWARQLGKGLKD